MKDKKLILGAIAGDIIGSAYEFNPIKTTDFELFVNKPNNEDDAKHKHYYKYSYITDDSIMTIATMDNILLKEDYTETYAR
jgi:ADP-ribosylglycohydrolase